MKFAKLALAAAVLSATPIAAHAAEVAVGAEITGPEGNVVGKVVNVADGVATVDTGKHKAPLPINVFGETPTGFTISVTKAQLDGMLDQQMAEATAKRDAALVEGASVMSADNVPVGTIKSIDTDADVIVLERDSGLVSLKREHFAADAAGLKALFTAEQLDANTVGS